MKTDKIRSESNPRITQFLFLINAFPPEEAERLKHVLSLF